MNRAGKTVLAALCAVMCVAATARAEQLQKRIHFSYCGSVAKISEVMPGETSYLSGTNGTKTSDGTTEIWFNKKNLNWTVVYVHPNGDHCIISSGKSLLPVKQKSEDDPA